MANTPPIINPFSTIKSAFGDVDAAANDIGQAAKKVVDNPVTNAVGTAANSAASKINNNQPVNLDIPHDIGTIFGGNKAPAPAKAKLPAAAKTANTLQPILNKAVAPYLSQLQSTLNNSSKQQYVQPWMPEAIKAPIAKFQQLTNKGLNGLYKDTATAASDFVPAAAASQILNILPTALAYNALSGSLPSFQNQPGLQALWQILEGTNAKLSNPAQTNNSDILNAISNLTPTASAPGTDPSTTGGI